MEGKPKAAGAKGEEGRANPGQGPAVPSDEPRARATDSPGLPAEDALLTRDGLPAKLPRGPEETAVVLGNPSDSRTSYCTCAMLRRAARRVTLVYDEALKPHGLRLTQYSLLASVLRSGGMTITDLAERLAMERTTLTRNLKPLQAAGWVKVKPGPDRRSRSVEITSDGRRLVEEAFPKWQMAERELRKSMGREEAAELRQLLTMALQATDESGLR